MCMSHAQRITSALIHIIFLLLHCTHCIYLFSLCNINQSPIIFFCVFLRKTLICRENPKLIVFSLHYILCVIHFFLPCSILWFSHLWGISLGQIHQILCKTVYYKSHFLFLGEQEIDFSFSPNKLKKQPNLFFHSSTRKLL